MAEWSGTPDPCDPANYWTDDATGERVDAWTGERTAHRCSVEPQPNPQEGGSV